MAIYIIIEDHIMIAEMLRPMLSESVGQNNIQIYSSGDDFLIDLHFGTSPVPDVVFSGWQHIRSQGIRI